MTVPNIAALRCIFGDQLTHTLPTLRDIDPAGDIVLMAEVEAECTYVHHHQKKLVLVLSAMRHFAAELRARGITVDYITLDDPANTHTLTSEMRRAAARHRPARIVVTEPAEWRLLHEVEGWSLADFPELHAIAVDRREDDRYACPRAAFTAWAQNRRELRMEFFYRDMRRSHQILMDNDLPAGGAWNYDRDNRKPLPATIAAPEIPTFPPDDTTQSVMALVAARFAGHFGAVEHFAFPVTAEQANAAAGHFFAHRLASFGDWQDAMRTGAPVLFHALISMALNLGLLDPLTLCRQAERCYHAGTAPLNAVEGFIRQILGWREFVRGVYWLRMPAYAQLNALDATRKLPWFYWSGETDMNCLHQVITDTRDHAYAHHIQRLMITGNFALLAGLDPAEVDEWYMIVYADAYEWVEMPNTRGMALYADGGIVGSKPYAASGAYINRMSNYCAACRYDVKDATGQNACPFNYLYWDFLARQSHRLAANQRMAMPLKALAKMDPAKLAKLQQNAHTFLSNL